MNKRLSSLALAGLLLGLSTSALAEQPLKPTTQNETPETLIRLYEKTKNSEVLTTLQDVIKHQQAQATIQNKHNKIFWGIGWGLSVVSVACVVIYNIKTNKTE